MNGELLPRDQGAPVRLVVPGWYGCTEVKWVNEIKLVDNDQPATLQMLEFGERTMQETRRDPALSTFTPSDRSGRATTGRQASTRRLCPCASSSGNWEGSWPIELSASPGEDRTGPKSSRSVSGGGRHEAPFEPVLFCKGRSSISSYGIWVHRWEPTKPGPYLIDVQLDAPGVRARKMAIDEPPRGPRPDGEALRPGG